jgi:hypothetical protein
MIIIGAGMDNKVSVSIDQIENGFIVRRSWCEKKGSGDKMEYNHKSEVSSF